MNSWSRYLRFAAFVGVLTGFLIQFPIDIVTKKGLGLSAIPAIYQGLLVSGIFFLVLFLVLAVFLKILSFLLKIEYGNYLECIFYTVSFSVIVTYFLITTFNFFFRIYLIFNSHLLVTRSPAEIFLPSLIILIISAVMTLFVLVKKKETLLVLFNESRAFRFLKKRVFKPMVIILIFFICIALVVDAYSYFGDSGGKAVQESPPDNMPNVLFILLASVRGDSMGFMGYPYNVTPFLDQLANDSVVFEQAMTTSPRSMLTDASLFTGTHAGGNSMFLNHQLLEKDGRTLAELMSENGYTTAGFISIPMLDKRSGLDRGFGVYTDRHSFFEFSVYSEFDVLYTLKNVPFLGPNLFYAFGDTTAEEVTDHAVSWLDKNKDEPFFLFVHYLGAHSPNTPDKRTVEELRSEETYMVGHSAQEGSLDSPMIAEAIRNKKLLYDAEIRETDRGVEQLVTHLDDIGLLDDTIVIILSDRGEEFYDHGGLFHGNTLYNEVLHVPFFIHYAKRLAPQRLKKRVSTLDLFSTILDLTDINPLEEIPSKSLLPFIEDNSVYNETANPIIAETIRTASPKGARATNYLVAIYSDRWKLILAKENKGRAGNALYNLESDPLEKNNLYKEEKEKREELKSLLFSHYKKSKAYLDSFPELGESDT